VSCSRHRVPGRWHDVAASSLKEAATRDAVRALVGGKVTALYEGGCSMPHEEGRIALSFMEVLDPGR
jgi:hypothetical protein